MIKVNCTCGMVKAGCIPLWKITYEWCSSHTLAKSYCIILNPPPWVVVKQTRVVLNCLVVAGDDHSQPLRAEYCNLKYSLMTTCEPKFQLTTNVTTEIVMLTGGGILKFQRDNKTFLCISSQFPLWSACNRSVEFSEFLGQQPGWFSVYCHVEKISRIAHVLLMTLLRIWVLKLPARVSACTIGEYDVCA